MDCFMRAFGTRYSKYFNRKYRRVGSLFQGVYKAVLVTTDEQLLYLSRYIHLNALKNGNFSQPSSAPEYFGQRQTPWLDTTTILSYFSKTDVQGDYQSFVSDSSVSSEIIASLAIDTLEGVASQGLSLRG